MPLCVADIQNWYGRQFMLGFSGIPTLNIYNNLETKFIFIQIFFSS